MRRRPHAVADVLPALAIRDLRVTFGRGRNRVVAVDGVTLDIWPGEIVGLVGESGSGKTLTGLAAMHLLPRRAALSGSIRLGAASLLDLSETAMQLLRGNRIALIPQDPSAALNPTMRIGRQIGEPLRLHRHASRAKADAAAAALLEAMHVRDAATRLRDYPHQFSGGMQQRAMIATGVALDPELLIADEPTTALDVRTQADLLRILRGIQAASGTSILFITHDLRVVERLCDWVYVMHRGRIVEDGPVGDILAAPRADPTRRLVAAASGLQHPPAA